MEIIGYLASILMGLSLGLLGGGGSILTVPILVYLFQTDPVLATSYSLFIVGLTALVGGLSYFRKGTVDLKTGIIFAVPSFIGVYLTRAFVIPNLPEEIWSMQAFTLTKPLLIMLVFALMMIAASISMMRGKSKLAKKEPIPVAPAVRYLVIGAEGLVVGAVTGFVGAGGGFLIIPALVVLVGLPMKTAVGTSLFIIAAKSLLGFLGDVQVQPELDWNLMLSISAISLLGLFFGMRISDRVPENGLKKGFGWFVLVMGILVLADQIVALI